MQEYYINPEYKTRVGYLVTKGDFEEEYDNFGELVDDILNNYEDVKQALYDLEKDLEAAITDDDEYRHWVCDNVEEVLHELDYDVLKVLR